MTVYHFEVVPFRTSKTVKCSGCGKTLRRAMTFDQTINPYNRNADGTVKNREEILLELRAEADEWTAQPESCPACLAAELRYPVKGKGK